MSAGEAPRVEPPPKFRSALEKLHRLFAGALHDAKFHSCHWAWHDIERTKSAKKKVEILNNRFEEWREGSADAIREWLPKFADLATAYPEVIDDPIHWAKDSVWETVEGICGIQRGPERKPLPIDRAVNPISVWWFAVASEFNPGVNIPPLRSWNAPRWLARGYRETNALLGERTGHFWLRVNSVINEEIDKAEIKRASNRKVNEHKAGPQSAKPSAYQGTSASRRRPVDPRKELIARLKARDLKAPARRICELIDQTIENTARIRKERLAPLESWRIQAPGARSWVDFYDHANTRNRVRTFVNKVPPLRTSK